MWSTFDTVISGSKPYEDKCLDIFHFHVFWCFSPNMSVHLFLTDPLLYLKSYAMSLPFRLVWCLLFLLSLDWPCRTRTVHKQQGGVLHVGDVIVPVQSVKQLDWNGSVMMDPLLVPHSTDLQYLMDTSLNHIGITKQNRSKVILWNFHPEKPY